MTRNSDTVEFRFNVSKCVQAASERLQYVQAAPFGYPLLAFSSARRARESTRSMPTIRLETLIAAPPDRCFDLSLSVDLHRQSVAHTHERPVAGMTTGVMRLAWGIP
jgi:hypothetical protein